MTMDYGMSELVPIVGKLAEKYTGHEHTSISYEKAEQLMEAVLYCICETEKENTEFAVRGEKLDAERVYLLGKHLVEEKVKKSLELYNHISAEFCDYGNFCLQNIFLKDLPYFFEHYNYQFAPQDTMIIINYSTWNDVSSDKGIDKIWNFLQSVLLEQKFLQAFPKQEIYRVLIKYDIANEGEAENLCEIILRTIMMNIFLGKYPLDSEFTKEDCIRLQELFKGMREDEIEKQFQKIVQKLVENYYGGDEKLQDYLCIGLRDMAVRTKNAVQNETLIGYLKIDCTLW